MLRQFFLGFIKIGILAPFFGAVEIVYETCILLGQITRFGAVLHIVNMRVALATTKIPVLLENGFLKMAHELHTDWLMLLGSLPASRRSRPLFLR